MKSFTGTEATPHTLSVGQSGLKCLDVWKFPCVETQLFGFSMYIAMQ